MLMGLVLAAAVLVLVCPEAAAAPVEARARSLRVRYPLCPYTVHRINHKLTGLKKKPVRWLEVKCQEPNKVFEMRGLEFTCTQLTYRAQIGDAKFKVGAGCVARLMSAGQPAEVVRPSVEES
ncbi:uncharacterized protein LOC135947140 [Cloeon dipterum]|uniref:uncharacterized protein LOC135947140 n=1 Tax=Cloeon dipterum TaxID=197152 RepID=UPI00322058F8